MHSGLQHSKLQERGEQVVGSILEATVIGL